jgi:hypothetical protein
MTRLKFLTAAALIVAPLAVSAQTTTAMKAVHSATRTVSEAAGVSPLPPLTSEAKSGLERMSAYLRTQKTFDLTASGSTEMVTSSGEKQKLTATLHYIASFPNNLFAEVNVGERRRRLYYDGQTVTFEIPDKNYYAQTALPGNVRTLIDYADQNFGVQLPLQDLFLWGSANPPAFPPRGAKVGTNTVNGVTYDHYAFSQEGVDWDLWTDQGEKPLPRRLRLTANEDPKRPSFTVDLNWNLSPTVSASQFTYTPSKDSARIFLKTADNAASSGGNR